MHSKILSIIIPVYNVEAFIERCLKSVEDQDLSLNEYEVISVNDGSTDCSLDILNRLSSHYHNIKIISQENKGLSEARNTGLKHATGKYIMFVDSDDWIEKNCLKKITTICEEDQLDLLRICAANCTNDGKIQRRFSFQDRASIMDGREVVRKGFYACAPFSIYRKTFLDENILRFFPGIYHEDNEFTPRVLYYAKRVEEINDVVYYVYQNPSSITRTVNPKKCFDNIIVAERLLDFASDKDEEWKKLTYHLVVRAINGCLYDSLNIDKDSKRMLNKTLFDKRALFKCYQTEKSSIHRLQGIFFSLFPRSVTSVYSIFKR